MEIEQITTEEFTKAVPRPLRVLFVIGSLGGGGTERNLIDLISNLDRRRISPRLYLSYRRGELLSEVPPDVPIDAFWDGQSQRSLGQRFFAKLRCPCMARALHLREVFKRHPVDVIVTWSLLSTYEVAMARMGNRIPHIACVRSEPKADLDDTLPKNFPFRYRIARWALRSASRVLANSTALRQQTISYYNLPLEHVETLFNIRDFNRIDRLAAAEPLVWPDLGQRVLAVGRLHPIKGFDVLLRAVARICNPGPAVQLTILGQGPEESALRQLAADLGIADRVRFLGFQPNPFLYYRSANAFVLSSQVEGLPNALLEAMTCRVPVVSTDCPTGPREILEDGRFGALVPVNDVEALSIALQNVFRSPPGPEALEAARQSAIQRYGVENGIHRLEQVLREVVGDATLPKESLREA